MLQKAAADALHVAAAAVAGVQYLLTLNCRHFAKAVAMRLVDCFADVEWDAHVRSAAP
jgi:hypothetical protein